MDVRAFIFEILGFRVIVQPFFFVLPGIFALYMLQDGRSVVFLAAMVAVFFVSILVHELGHALAARTLKVQVGDIVIHGLGGYVTHGHTTPARQLIISLLGPGAGFALAGVSLVAANVVPPEGQLGEVLMWCFGLNLFWSALNLFPILPLDGGNALRSLLGIFTTTRTAMLVSGGIGSVLGALLAIGGVLTSEIFLMYIGGMGAYTSYRSLSAARAAPAG